MKKILMAFLIAAGMGLTVPLYAQETGVETENVPEQTNPSPITLTIDRSLDGHTFAAYQIFTGDVDGTTLSNVQWGDGVNSVNLITALNQLSGFPDIAESASAKDVADAIAQYTADDENLTKAREIALLIHHNVKENSGIQLVDSTTLVPGYYLIVDTSQNTNPSFTWNETLLQLTGDMEIKKKLETPTVEKKVLDNDEKDPNNQYKDVVDHSIGDEITFRLTSTVPETDHFQSYKYVFHDTLSKGLTFKEDSIAVWVGEDQLQSQEFNVLSTINNDDGTTTLEITVPYLKGEDEKVVLVTYKATLNEKAAVGINEAGQNLNTVTLRYSNHPYNEEMFEETPPDQVLILTYTLKGTKKDSKTQESLENAEFKLLDETRSKYAVLNGNKFVSWADLEAQGTTLTSKKNGEFEIQGLDAGTYYLKEIKAPTGYNIMEKPQQVVVSAMKASTYDSTSTPLLETSSSNDSASEQGTVHVDQSGTANVTVYNGKGFTMPQTGAVGQSLIYGAGAVLAIGGLGIRIIRHRKEE